MTQEAVALPSVPEEPAEAQPARHLFGTFGGVFTPTLLTILGVIMYLRLGWVVGNAGLLGGWIIMSIAVAITLSTGLSLSSIATNTRLGAGGPYAIISRSLGKEIGGSVGVPLYLSQALAVAMYIFGLREGWVWIFPEHPALLVDLVAFAVVFGIAYVSASLAFKIQYVVMAIIVASLVSIVAAPDVWTSSHSIEWWGTFKGSPENAFSGVSFWVVFAVFFPAATGIMAGANMSGELKNPRKSIPLGTLSAIALSTVVYFILAFWVAKAAPPDALVSNYTIMVDKALYGPLVLAGLIGATFSSALGSLVGAPRILMALGNDRMLPKGKWLAETAKNGEPRRGMLLTGAIVLGALLLRDLNLIAPLISMFFLIAYAVINVVMLVESSLGLMSFRPTLRLPKVVPLIGTVGCIFAMFIVNPTFSLVAVGLVIAMYFWMLRRGIKDESEDVRSGVFVAFAEWAAAKVMELDIMQNVRSWKPNLLVPVQDGSELRGDFRLLIDICEPEGSIKLLGLATDETVSDLTPRITGLKKSLQRRGVFSTASVVDSTDYRTGVVAGLQALGSAFFRPNVLFLNAGESTPEILKEARRLKVGVMMLAHHPKAAMGRENVVNLWFTPESWNAPVAEMFDRNNLNLAVLTAYRIARSWDADLHLLGVARTSADAETAERVMEELRDLCRFEADAHTQILVGTLEEAAKLAPQSDLDVLALPPNQELEAARKMVELTRSSCLFTSDSGQESAVA